MNKLITLLTGFTFFVFILIMLPNTIVYSKDGRQQADVVKPPEVIKGGMWNDDFWIGQLQEGKNIDIQVSHLFLKYKEQLHWTQTWTVHFALGNFFQTEAISDSVRLAWNPAEQNFYTTGIYTSTVFDPGKAVDWAALTWRFSGIPDGLLLETRTGNTPNPDESWTDWERPAGGIMEYYCAYTINADETQCFTNMHQVESSKFIQYRGLFSSNHPTNTISLFEIDITYGIHYLTGDAVSISIPPVDLRAWDKVAITATIPANTSMIVDITSPDGTVLVPNVMNGTSLEAIDPKVYPALQFRVSFATTDESITPDIDMWGLRWKVMYRSFVPTMLR